MEITLNEGLQPLGLSRYDIKDPKRSFIDQKSDKKIVDWKTLETRQTLFPVTDNLAGEAFHDNYLQYLETAYGRHYGVVLSPDHMWYTLLSELTLIIAEKPEKFRHLFTKETEGKKEISVPTDSETVLPLDLISKELRRLVPDGFADHFLLDFSTSTARSSFALQAAFADAVSPFYSYSMFCCGIPYVKVLGTKQDWARIEGNWAAIGLIFGCEEAYFKSVYKILDDIVGQFDEVDPEFWRGIFFAEQCGSGSQTEIGGWWTSLLRKQPDGPRFSKNFSTHIAKVRYKNLSSGNHYEMINGIFSSVTEGPYLVPEFSHVVYHDRSTAA